jgi:hypothetical protein
MSGAIAQLHTCSWIHFSSPFLPEMERKFGLDHDDAVAFQLTDREIFAKPGANIVIE